MKLLIESHNQRKTMSKQTSTLLKLKSQESFSLTFGFSSWLTAAIVGVLK